MMEPIIKIALSIGLILFGPFLIAQTGLNSVSLSTDKCAHIRSNTTSNYNEAIFDVRTYYRAPNQSYRRAFIEFDVSSIPSNAIIYSATLKITHNGIIYGSNPWRTKLVKSSWGETTVTSINQPTISALAGDVSSTYTTASDTVNIDVKDMVQRMTYGQITNYGWSIQVNDESVTSATGATFYSDEYTTTTMRPKLEIEYYYPLSLASVVVDHESASGALDGGVSYDLSNGASDNYTFNWINSSGTSVSTDSILTGVSYGWYGLEVTGDEYGDKLFMAFLIGLECSEVTIDFEATSANNFSKFMDNAYNSNYDNGIIDRSETNSGDNVNFQSGREYIGGVDFNSNSYLRFNLWMDDAFTVNQADLELQGKDHDGAFNEAKFDLVTEGWNESLITWGNQPASVSTPTVLLSQTLSTGEDKTADLIDFWQEWKADNTENHGMLFQLQSFASYTNKQHYHSPTATTVADRPMITFTLALEYLDDLLRCNPDLMPYIELSKTQDGGYGASHLDTLKFSMMESYSLDSSQYLRINIYDESHEVEASCDRAGSTSGGMIAVKSNYGDNRYKMDLSGITTLIDGAEYLLEVIDAKGQQYYLKFIHNN